MNPAQQSDGVLVAVERVPTRILGLTSLVAVGVPLALAVALDGPAAIGAVIVSVVAVASVGGVWRVRSRLRGLPLEIGAAGVRGTLDGRPAFWFRARLGMGRFAKRGSAEISWRGDDGTVVVLDTIAAPGPRVGAWTVIAVDRSGRVASNGAFVVRVTADDGRSWTEERVIAQSDVRDGRFGATWGEVRPPVP